MRLFPMTLARLLLACSLAGCTVTIERVDVEPLFGGPAPEDVLGEDVAGEAEVEPQPTLAGCLDYQPLSADAAAWLNAHPSPPPPSWAAWKAQFRDRPQLCR